jgi:hypothetical protein
MIGAPNWGAHDWAREAVLSEALLNVAKRTWGPAFPPHAADTWMRATARFPVGLHDDFTMVQVTVDAGGTFKATGEVKASDLLAQLGVAIV